MENKKIKQMQEDDEKTTLSQNISKDDSKAAFFKFKENNIILGRLNAMVNNNKSNSINSASNSKPEENLEEFVSPAPRNMKLKNFQEDIIMESCNEYSKSSKSSKKDFNSGMDCDISRKLAIVEKIVRFSLNKV